MADSGGSDAKISSDRIPIVIISGPTASGKSSLAISLAHEYDAEIISADSRQIYRQLKIGTDRLDEGQWQGIPHHLMGVIDLGERFTVFDFVRRAEEIIIDVHNRGKRIIVCGGTGLYIRALTDGIYELQDEDLAYRNELLELVAAHGVDYLYARLAEIDPEAAAQLHPHNVVRVIRAMELHHLTGLSRLQRDNLPSTKNPRFQFLHIILLPDRDALYRKINDRVETMIEEGLFEEVERLYNSDTGEALKAAKVVGYHEIILYLRALVTRNEAINLIMQNTRRFAKRQYTWFRGVKKAAVLEYFGNDARPEVVKLLGDFWA